MKEFNLTGSIVAIVTPFTATGEIDVDAFDKLIDWHVEEGTDGIVVCGTTGETPALSQEEDVFLIKHTVDRVKGRIPVIAGTGSNSTSECIKYSLNAQEAGVDGVLVVGPYYNKPTDQGMYLHFSNIAQAVSVPIILYNVPSRTGSKISVDVALKLANDFDNIVGIKEAGGDLNVMAQLIALRPPGYKVYSGDDFLASSANLLGADGCISVIANVLPAQFREMMQASLTGNVVSTRELFFKYRHLMDLMFIESNPIPVKTALAVMGLIEEHFRSPMCPMANGGKELLVSELKKLDII
ncbi:MAG: 4-hydroxy-tetrahydrodipicolinate synthase [Marinilabiliaceae bacterium]|nr:4-hydroxy-tetrahydrodipicolinate synthase [Marinilabiliaceae bacterium]